MPTSARTTAEGDGGDDRRRANAPQVFRSAGSTCRPNRSHSARCGYPDRMNESMPAPVAADLGDHLVGVADDRCARTRAGPPDAGPKVAARRSRRRRRPSRSSAWRATPADAESSDRAGSARPSPSSSCRQQATGCGSSFVPRSRARSRASGSQSAACGPRRRLVRPCRPSARDGLLGASGHIRKTSAAAAAHWRGAGRRGHRSRAEGTATRDGAIPAADRCPGRRTRRGCRRARRRAARRRIVHDLGRPAVAGLGLERAPG